MNDHKAKYRPDIDGLRALAVLAVVFYHAFPTLLTGGFVGVDVFFVISGFLITKIIFEELDSNQFSFLDFFSRRVRRIFPALILVLAVSLIFGWYVLLPNEYAQLGKHVMGSVGFIQNFILWHEAGYFDNSADVKPLLHIWSLGVEEQFYILWPLALWLAWKRKLNLLTITVSILFLSFFWNYHYRHSYPVAGFFWPIGRFWELLSGSLIAWFFIYKRDSLKFIKIKANTILNVILFRKNYEGKAIDLSDVLSVLGFSILLICFFKLDKELTYPGVWALGPVLGASFIIISGKDAWLNRVLLGNKIVIWFGLISYPLYLWHWPIMSFLRIIKGDTPHHDARLLAVILSILLAWFTYKIIENPIRKTKRRNIQIGFLVFSMIFIGYAGYNIYNHNGYKSRVSSNLNDHETRVWRISGNDFDKKGVKSCNDLLKSTSSSFCATVSDPKVALIGDSHAGALFYGFINNTSSFYSQASVYGAGSCQPSLDVEARPGCNAQLKIALEEITSNPKIEVVVMTGYYSFFNDTSSMNKYLDGFNKTFDLLNDSGKKVVYLIDNPTLQKSAELCAPKNISVRDSFSSKENFCSNISKSDLRDQNQYFEFVDNLKNKNSNVDFFDSKSVLCPDEKCMLYSEGKLLYSDFNHLSIYGSLFVADALIKHLSKYAYSTH
tara:strand:+ start:544 stop:2541 length:1998 start_codon:yes stop_codon:yes gene_type:complete